MPLPDYHERVERLQRGLARAWLRDPALLNLPGRSIACKLDPNYYLAAQPFFDTEIARAAGMLPATAAQALVKSGLLITRPPEREHVLQVGVVYAGHAITMPASFLDADFVDRALRLYGGAPHGLQVADLRLAAESREAVEHLFEGKTPPGRVCFAS